MNSFTAFVERKNQLQKSTTELIEIVEAELNSQDIQVLQRFKHELSADLSFKILCIGDFSSGKSTFMNQFLLQEDILPAFPKPTTTRPTIIRFGEKLKACLYFQDGSQEEVSEQVAQRLLETVSAGGNDVEQVSYVILESPSAILQDGVELVDAPGLNDPDAERMKQTFDYLHNADAILFFLNAQQPWTRYQATFFEQELLSKQDIDKLFVIANYWDQIENSEREDVLDYLQQQLRVSLEKTQTESEGIVNLQVLPVSSKTGENSEQVKQLIWDYLGERKSYDVLANRVQRLNSYIGNYTKSLDEQIILVKQDRKSREKHRASLESEIADYAKQREQFNFNLRRALKPEFEEYKSILEDLFDQLIQKIKMVIEQLIQKKPSKDNVNTQLSAQVSRLQYNLMREIKIKEHKFLEQIKSRIEEQKGIIDLPPNCITNIEDYFLKWSRVSEIESSQTATVASGVVGIAGIIIGSGTLMQSAAVTQGAFSALGGWMFGSSASATLALGLPGVVIGITALCTAFYFNHKESQEIARQLEDSALQIEQSVVEKKWECIDQITNNQSQNLDKICLDVDHEINQTYQQKLKELKQIESIVDQGAQLETLSKVLNEMKVEVNP